MAQHAVARSTDEPAAPLPLPLQEKACLLLSAVVASRPDKAGLVAAGPGTSASAAAGAPSTSAAAAAADEVQKAVASFIDWLCAQLRRPSDPARSVPTAVHALSQLLREPPMRVMLHRAGGVQLVAPLVAMPAPGSGQLNIQVRWAAGLFLRVLCNSCLPGRCC